VTAPTLTASAQPSARSAATAVKVADIAVKVSLVVLILMAVTDPDLGGVKAKAGGSRAIAYPLAMMLVPTIWWLFYRARPFPWLGDLLLCLPWFTDTLGNRLNLYDSISWFDDWMHFMNWAFLTAGFLVITLPRGLPWWRSIERALAFGVPTAVLWEIVEYITFIRWSPELETAYTDTLGDVALGSIGTILAAVVVWLSRRSNPHLGAPERIG
jgi:glycopeptide antibiotics resistance protein